MGNFGELSGLKQWAALVLGAALITGALHFTLFKSQRAANDQAQSALESKLRENAELQSYAPKLKDMERQLANLKQQLEIERRIVPDDKEVDGFIKMLDAEALKAGIEIDVYKRQVRAPSHERGVRGVDRRAQEHPQHTIVSVRARRLWLVCGETGHSAVWGLSLIHILSCFHSQ